jgi:hypothetical protein
MKDEILARLHARKKTFTRAFKGGVVVYADDPLPEALAQEAVFQQPEMAVDLEIERAEIVNEAFDLVISRLGSAAPVEPEAPLLPAPDALMSDYGPIDPKDAETIIDGFTGELRTSRDTAEGTMRSMDPPDRRRLFSILNTELGRLKNQEALLGKSIPRRADVEELIGILAKVGEA